MSSLNTEPAAVELQSEYTDIHISTDNKECKVSSSIVAVSIMTKPKSVCKSTPNTYTYQILV